MVGGVMGDPVNTPLVVALVSGCLAVFVSPRLGFVMFLAFLAVEVFAGRYK